MGTPLAPPENGGRAPKIFGRCLLRPSGWMDEAGTWHGGRPQPRRLCVRWGPSPLPQFSAHFYCGQTAGWIKMALGMEVGLGPVRIVLEGDTAPLLKKGGRAPIFGPSLLRPNGWMQQDATSYGGRPQPKQLCVSSGPSLLPQKRRSPTQFSAHVDCGQTAACIKMPFGMEVGLSLRDTVFDMDPATPRKRAHPPHPIFGPCLLWPNGWLDEDTAWVGSRPQPRPHCTRRGPSSRERGTAAHLFSVHVHCGHGRPSQLLLLFAVHGCVVLYCSSRCSHCLLAHISVVHSINMVK